MTIEDTFKAHLFSHIFEAFFLLLNLNLKERCDCMIRPWKHDEAATYHSCVDSFYFRLLLRFISFSIRNHLYLPVLLTHRHVIKLNKPKRMRCKNEREKNEKHVFDDKYVSQIFVCVSVLSIVFRQRTNRFLGHDLCARI